MIYLIPSENFDNVPRKKYVNLFMITAPNFWYLHGNLESIFHFDKAYMYVDWDTKKTLCTEIGDRLYINEGIYDVTGEPPGYDLIAMDADESYGFVYALKPENEDNTVTYSAVMFCNYFLDVDIDDYMPEKYQLEGFDANENNPYRKKMMSAAK